MRYAAISAFAYLKAVVPVELPAVAAAEIAKGIFAVKRERKPGPVPGFLVVSRAGRGLARVVFLDLIARILRWSQLANGNGVSAFWY